jgi:hypothetical protein
LELPFLKLAMISPGRQFAFRRTAILHILSLAGLGWMFQDLSPGYLPYFGDALLVLGIIEGAALIGWRLAQLPKSQALEFLLASPLSPWRVFAAEAAAGMGRLALVTLCGLPVLLILSFAGQIEWSDIPFLIVIPFLWGSIAGLGLTVWAYERLEIRRWGERIGLVLIILYLVVGVLAAERLRNWLGHLPADVGQAVYSSILLFTQYNPFGVTEYWLSRDREMEVVWPRVQALFVVSWIVVLGLLARAACRLKGHFHDRHYKPAIDRNRRNLGGIGERPLSWWAVRRVLEYSGRLNIWLAGGFGLIYAAYIVLGDAWPVWLGRMVFQIFERLGGVPVLSTGLIVLAAVPAAFQYGLWDASTQDRCKRLELLLLTELDGTDYWLAAAAAAWRRGRGYFFVAVVLLLALGVSGRATLLQVAAAIAAGVILWTFSFALGFRAFSRGMHANGLGSFLTLGLPILAGVLIQLRVPVLSSLVPAGAVYLAQTGEPSWRWLPGPVLIGIATLSLASSARSRCERELRFWFDRNQGRKSLD